jgi:ParB family transcriptional regulator, chromosome partitioning protein
MSKVQRSKSRLGRGLSSLLNVGEDTREVASDELEVASPVHIELPPPRPPAQVDAATPASPAEVPVELVDPNPHQPRRDFDPASLAELTASLKSNGLIQPIVLRKVGDRYQLIAGERRLRAARMAGLVNVPFVLRDVDSFTQAQMALVENIQRQDLNPIDRAEGYRTLVTQLGLTQAELAGRLGEDRSSIANYVRLLDLAESVRESVRGGRLSLGHAKLLAGVSDPLEQERLGQLVIAQGLSVRNLERLIQDQAAPPPSPRTVSTRSAHLADLEKNLARQLGMRVQVRRSGRSQKGRLVIHYASLDQFDELLNRLGVSVDA